MAVLTALEGVGYPVASCVLHFAHRDPYSIVDPPWVECPGRRSAIRARNRPDPSVVFDPGRVDRRTRESLGDLGPMTQFREVYWQEYVRCCRQLANENRISMRDLDRAL